MVNFRIPPIKSDFALLESAYLLYKYLNVVAPERCQRPLCWHTGTKTKYFKSLLMNRVEGTFIFIDIESAFIAIKREYHSNEKSYKFFKDLLDQGYKYIVIDGNNRYHFMEDLFNDNWLIPQGEYQYIADTTTGRIETFQVVNRQRKFSNLPSRVQKAIKSRKSPVSEYSQLDLAGLADVFTNINSGIALNRQELRNVMDVDYADLIRDLEDDVMPLLTDLIDKPKLGLKGQEFLVDCVDFILNGIVLQPHDDDKDTFVYTAINQGTKDKLYLSKADSQEFWSIGANLKLIQEYLPRMVDDEILGSKGSRKIKRNSAVQNLLWMMCNGLDPSYDSCVSAMILAEQKYCSSKRYPDIDDKSFKDSCEGMNKECMEIRQMTLNSVIEEVERSYLSV